MNMRKLWMIAALLVAMTALVACSSSRPPVVDPTVHTSSTPTVGQESLPPGQVRASQEMLETGKRKWRVGDMKNAAKAFERAINKNPYNFEAHYWLAMVQRDNRQWERAGGHFTQAVKYCPQGRWEARIRVDWGYLYEIQGQKGMAAKQYDLALLADPDYKDAQYGKERVLPLPSAQRSNGKAKGHNK